MRNSITHSGALNDEPYYTFSLVEIRHASISVDGASNASNLRVEISEKELRALILSGCFALEDRRLRDLFSNGELTADKFEEAKRKLDREGPPMPTLASLLPSSGPTKA